MALFKTLKQVTDAKWIVDIIASAAGKHRCFTEHFKVQDATAQYKETCGPLIAEMVKNKSCYLIVILADKIQSCAYCKKVNRRKRVASECIQIVICQGKNHQKT